MPLTSSCRRHWQSLGRGRHEEPALWFVSEGLRNSARRARWSRRGNRNRRIHPPPYRLNDFKELTGQVAASSTKHGSKWHHL